MGLKPIQYPILSEVAESAYDGDPFLRPPVGYPEGYPYGFDVMQISDEAIEAIYHWLVANLGPRDDAWVYQFSFPHKYAAVWIMHSHHAMEFKLRWL